MKKVLSVVAAFVLAITFAGSTASAAHHEGMVRVLHASPDAPAVDVYVDGNAVVEGAEFKDATDYLNLEGGEHQVEVYAAGTKGSEEPVISTSVNVEGGMAYTVAAVGTLDSIQLKVVQDSMDVTEGKSKVRVGHFSPDAPAVDVGPIGGDALFSGAEFPMVTDYKELDPGTYDLEVRTADGGQQVLDLSGTMLEKNTVYSVFAVNTADSLEAIVLKDATLMPDSMPKTGMGGASETTNSNSALYVAAGAVVLAAGTFLVFRRRSEA
ncbi:peptidase [Pontibacillus halophilus JSM 076056 = DSM 19796]|uniref:Peptidase n=1 Tax=Pontibacillus halophilus JSM 076056 = DSM 19796 TaxID=1385510 RepID=A0A0A5GS33_9BACI|nr:DUF4397 domain-containing protein [Pontibacillus halophilus]KGX94028.1 peptidase [Pontibacillus halophilus JSM 076056 = DSM 19796]